MTVYGASRGCISTVAIAPAPQKFGDVNGRWWYSTAGHDRESMIIWEWRKPVAMSRPVKLGVAKTMHLSGKAATSAMGWERPPAVGIGTSAAWHKADSRWIRPAGNCLGIGGVAPVAHRPETGETPG